MERTNSCACARETNNASGACARETKNERVLRWGLLARAHVSQKTRAHVRPRRNWIYHIYGYSIEIQISDIAYYKVCSIWYTEHFIFERSLASQNCFVALWHLWIVVLMLSTSQIEEVLQNCLIWENRKHYTKLQWSVLQQSLLQLQLHSTTPLQENYNFNLTYNYTLYNHNCNLQPNYITLQLHLQDTRPTARN